MLKWFLWHWFSLPNWRDFLWSTEVHTEGKGMKAQVAPTCSSVIGPLSRGGGELTPSHNFHDMAGRKCFPSPPLECGPLPSIPHLCSLDWVSPSQSYPRVWTRTWPVWGSAVWERDSESSGFSWSQYGNSSLNQCQLKLVMYGIGS